MVVIEYKSPHMRLFWCLGL